MGKIKSVDRDSTVFSGFPARLLVGVLLGVLASLAIVSSASAGSGCAQQVIEDWADDGVIGGSYSPACYQEAIASLPEDLRSYSSASDDIGRALQASLLPEGSSDAVDQSGGTEAGEATDPPTGGAAGADEGGAAAANGDDSPASEGSTPGEDSATTPAEASAAPADELGDGGAGLPPVVIALIAVAAGVGVAVLATLGWRKARGRA
jgi:hypothetical protein